MAMSGRDERCQDGAGAAGVVRPGAGGRRRPWGPGVVAGVFLGLAGSAFVNGWLAATRATAHTLVIRTNFPTPFNSEPASSGAPPTAAAAAAGFRVPDGFRVTVFASEPEVQNPIAMAWDARGRLWVAENYTYAERGRRLEETLRDRVILFEDADGDGRAERRRVFTEDVQALTSVEIGLGGVWLMCPPRLLFVPDRNGDDVPDGAPEVVLDGFTIPAENHHTLANGLRWGPDGWLYGRCGASSPGEIGRPGTPAAARVPVRGGIWRYHPGRRSFEVLAHGTTNPWGHDWNELGELFFINTVNGHLWHAVPGMHLARPHSVDPNPRVYQLIDQHADHWHFDTGRGWTQSRDGRADAYGGGHAHVGLMIYQGLNWPGSYRGKLLTLNLHGRRANVERLERLGSGYVGRHEPDILVASDPWFRGMDLSAGPDGGVYLLDWSDAGECHESTGVHRTSGRIYKVTHQAGPAPSRGPRGFGGLTEEELLERVPDRNGWVQSQVRREIHERRARGVDLRGLAGRLRQRVSARADHGAAVRLSHLWAWWAAVGGGTEARLSGADRDWLRTLLRDPDESLRAWAIRLLVDEWPLDTVMSERPAGATTPAGPGDWAEAGSNRAILNDLVRMAGADASGLVRLVLASTLQRLPVTERAGLAAALVGRTEDAADHNLPAMIWYGLIPVGAHDPGALAEVGVKTALPETLRWVARRLAEDIEARPGPVDRLLSTLGGRPEALQVAILQGLTEAFIGWRRATPPASWPAVARALDAASDERLRTLGRELGVVFGDGRALAEVRRMALDSKADLAARRSALQALIDSRAADARAVCEQLLTVRYLNATAVRGLAGHDDPELGRRLARSWGSFHPADRGALLETLVSRPAFALALLEEMAAGRIPRAALSAFHARQLRGLGNEALTRRLAVVWGELADSDAAKRARIEQLKQALTQPVLAKADKSRGRVLYATACAACHRLYGEGGAIGPDLTGSGRDNLDYLLENIVDPGGVVSADYRMTVVETRDGRSLNGVLAAQTERTLTLRTMVGTQTVERSEVESMETSRSSLMPEGLLDPLTAEEVRDLIGYLMHPVQVPLPPGAPVMAEPAR